MRHLRKKIKELLALLRDTYIKEVIACCELGNKRSEASIFT